MWWLILLGLVVVVGLTALLSRLLGAKEGIQLASTIVGTISTVVLGVFAAQQMVENERRTAIESSAKWGDLRNAMYEAFDMYPVEGVAALRSLDDNPTRAAWLSRMRRILDSQISNPVLLADSTSLAHWRNAIALTIHGRTLEHAGDHAEHMFLSSAGGILGDVSAVWTRLVLESDEVSPTGGRPSPPPTP